MGVVFEEPGRRILFSLKINVKIKYKICLEIVEVKIVQKSPEEVSLEQRLRYENSPHNFWKVAGLKMRRNRRRFEIFGQQ